MTFDIVHDADRQALDLVLGVRPVWSAMARASEVAGIDSGTLLHAGPGFDTPDAITRPILNSAKVSAVFEGIAGDFADAERKIRSGEIRLAPAQDYHVVTPLAAVVSPSMLLHEVVDRNQPATRAWSPVNGGNGPAPRLGLCTDEALSHLHWMYKTLAPILARALRSPVDLIDIARLAVDAGDDCHGRTPVATRILLDQLRSDFELVPNGREASEFVENAPGFFLNVWMAASKCMLNAAQGIRESSLVVTAGANGADTGIQLAGLPGRWFTHPAAPPRGSMNPGVAPERALGAIGDSAIVDALGFGAMAMRHSPEQRKSLESYMPATGLALADALLSRIHPAFGALDLPLGLTARACVETGLSPVVGLGILDRQGELGRLGGGIYQQPGELFEQALVALDDQHVV